MQTFPVKDVDLSLWQEYKRMPNAATRKKLLDQFSGLIAAQVNKWAGPVSRDVLMNEAKILAAKAFDSFNPNAGASLSTHVTNSLLPLSRIVYTYQNTARLPENISMRISAYNSAVEDMKGLYGREPTTDELHNSLGWSSSEISRIRDYSRKNLVESGPAVSGDFFTKSDGIDDDVLLGGIYMELAPDEKQLFELTTGYNRPKALSNAEIMKTLHMSQAQLSYKKRLLRQRLETIMSRPGIKNRIGG